MKVELFYSPGCAECSAAQARLRAAAQDAVKQLEWREVSAIEELDYAVELGVLTLPSIAIDGELAFTSMPTPEQLREALLRRIGKGA
ncbi:MAG: glutaredoxin [Hyphomicrobiaceae bacterium]|nr:MAG: glutaredoxin [Hyphomicrobiaceae bacterium]